jgi:lipid II:glycine glycyltransferase (peptidoglycan interpeptide bridge formation enzyme)
VAVIAERISLEELSRRDSANVFLQSALWAQLKQSFGWKALPVKWRRGDEAGVLLILIRNLIPGLSLAYIPHGPEAEAGGEDRELFLIELARELRGVLPLGCFFIRFDLPEFRLNGEDAPLYDKPLVKAPLDIQPPDTVVLPLNLPEDRRGEDLLDSILAGMHKKTRYNIRLAAKKGVRVEVCGREKLKDWYTLSKITAVRDKIGIHGFGYYDRLFDLVDSSAVAEQELQLLMAYSPEDELLAGVIILFRGREAVYLYGASSNENRQLMPAYALQWQALRTAVEKQCGEYDLYGIPPTDDPEHPMHGLYRFKTGFGGEIRHRPGTWDYPYSHLLYLFYKLMEHARRFYHKKWKKRR